MTDVHVKPPVGLVQGAKPATPLPPPASILKNAASPAGVPAAQPHKRAPSKIFALCKGIQNNVTSLEKLSSCKQTIWFSFFFDGTGNNMDADEEKQKHSSVARLYKIHMGDENNGGVEPRTKNYTSGVYRLYIPGLGTYFDKVHDKGGTKWGLGFASFGSERLDWALRVFDKKMAPHIRAAANPANEIIEVNIAAFGFSRGAALARAFIHDFVKERCRQVSKDHWVLKGANCPVRIRFMGLFDTVASVGFAMGANSLNYADAGFGNTASHLFFRNNFPTLRSSQPMYLAFAKGGEPGADPSPGLADGHVSWGGRMRIPDMVDDVRHIVAAHEFRNSFPLESVRGLKSDGTHEAANPRFHEYVFPGAHSDVGGSYRPGEGGKNERKETKLGLIALNKMYQMAIDADVPLLPPTAWGADRLEDFDVDAIVYEDFHAYMKPFMSKNETIGDSFNRHMKFYYQWRFLEIARKRRKTKPDTKDADRIAKSEVEFKGDREKLEKEVEISKDEFNRIRSRASARENSFYVKTEANRAFNENLDAARVRTLDKLRRTQAKLKSVPDHRTLVHVISLYDEQLMKDAETLRQIIQEPNTAAWLILRNEIGFDPNLATLRPHYKVMYAAYINQFYPPKPGTPLYEPFVDMRMAEFFDKYVHDSLAGFGVDGTLPSDPRVIYATGDRKVEYARLDENSSSPLEEHSQPSMIGSMA